MPNIKVPYTELSNYKTARTEAGLKRLRAIKPRPTFGPAARAEIRKFIARCEALKGLR